MKDQCISVSSYVSRDDESPSSSASEGTSSPPRREIRGLRLFKIISQRLGHLRRRQENKENNQNRDGDENDTEDSYSSNSSCDSALGSTSLESPVHGDRLILRRSTDGRSSSTGRISTTTRSLADKRSSVPEPLSQQRKNTRSILRAPVSYTYKKGLSGLPTQRVPICKGRCNCQTQHEVFRSYEDLHQYRYIVLNL